MKKIVDFIKSVFADHFGGVNIKNYRKINFWCPTGMNPIMH